jgi:hypothetical protein
VKGEYSVRNFQELNEPQLVELESEQKFVIVTEIDLSEIKNQIIFMKGRLYGYEGGLVTEHEEAEIQYSLTEDAWYRLDENGKVIDDY